MSLRPRTFWKGSHADRSQRIRTGAHFWDSLIFASSDMEGASWYGPDLQCIEALPEAKILYEGTKEFCVLAKGTSRMNLLEQSETIAKRALEAGYDAVWFKRQTDVGTAILNADAFIFSASTMNQSDFENLCQQLLRLGRDLFGARTIVDLQGEYIGDPEDGYTFLFAWILKPQQMEKLLDTMILPFDGKYVTYRLRAEGIKSDLFEYEREMAVSDFFDRLASAVPMPTEDVSDVNFTFIPDGGWIWPPADPKRGIYSAKQKKWFKPEKPEWLLPENVVIPGMKIDQPGINLCKLLANRLPDDYALDATYIDVDGDLIVMASTSMIDIEATEGRMGTLEENAKFINECGGLLMPSLAVGDVPASNFGVLCLVADIGLVLRSLKQGRRSPSSKEWFRRRGEPAAGTLYNSDAWTSTTRDFFGMHAIHAFNQMHGHSNYMYYAEQTIWPLGAPNAYKLHSAHAPERVRQLVTDDQMYSAVEKRAKKWPRGMTPEKVLKARESYSMTEHRYPYLEFKVNAVMPIGDFPLAVFPKQSEERLKPFLKSIGFKGEMVAIDLPNEIAEVMAENWHPNDIEFEMRQAIQSWAWMEYGHNVHDAVVKHGHRL